MKKILLSILFFATLAQAQTKETAAINTTLDAWHKAAADAKFDTYFNMMSDESIFIGTDATENWNKKAFMDFAGNAARGIAMRNANMAPTEIQEMIQLV